MAERATPSSQTILSSLTTAGNRSSTMPQNTPMTNKGAARNLTEILRLVVQLLMFVSTKPQPKSETNSEVTPGQRGPTAGG